MTTDKDEPWRTILDRVSENKALAELVEVPPSLVHDTEADQETMERIKAATFARLGLQRKNGDIGTQPASYRRHPSRRRKLLAGATVALLLLASCSLISPDVRAQVGKAIQFLPGFGVAQETEGHASRYILPDPVIVKAGSRRVEVRGVSIGEKQSSVTMVMTAPVQTFTLHNGKGQEYPFRYSTISGGGEWIGGYYYNGAIDATGPLELILGEPYDDVHIPISLQKTEGADKIEQLGVTDSHLSISLTAVKHDAEDGRSRVTLLPQLPLGQRIEAYGFGDFDHLARPQLSTAEGTPLAIEQDSSYPNPNEFLFKRPEAGAGAQSFLLRVPELLVILKPEIEPVWTIPIPQSGSLDVEREFTLEGFPVTLRRVERLPGTPESKGKEMLKLIWDLHTNPSASRSLRWFALDIPRTNPEETGYMFKNDESTWTMEFSVMTLPSNAKSELKLYVQEAHAVYRGPWTFTLPQ